MLGAIVFDAYGTLLDVHSVVQDRALSALWRQKQLEYTWLRSLMGEYEDFGRVTEDALRTAAAQLKIELDVEEAMQSYLRPKVFEEARYALEELKDRRLAILSNGTSKMLEASLRYGGIETYFEHIISAERVRIYKPSPKVYALGPESIGLAAREMMFVSSNAWDAAGAKAFGYFVCWCNRSRTEMEELGFDPDITVNGLDELADAVKLGRL